jgi:hypothetical protein
MRNTVAILETLLNTQDSSSRSLPTQSTMHPRRGFGHTASVRVYSIAASSRHWLSADRQGRSYSSNALSEHLQGKLSVGLKRYGAECSCCDMESSQPSLCTRVAPFNTTARAFRETDLKRTGPVSTYTQTYMENVSPWLLNTEWTAVELNTDSKRDVRGKFV